MSLEAILLVVAVAVYVWRNPALAQHNFQEAVKVFVELIRRYLQEHPESTERMAELIADAYEALPASVQRIIPERMFETLAAELLTLIEFALLRPHPALPSEGTNPVSSQSSESQSLSSEF